jgi:hypothetical protein
MFLYNNAFPEYLKMMRRSISEALAAIQAVVRSITRMTTIVKGNEPGVFVRLLKKARIINPSATKAKK